MKPTVVYTCCAGAGGWAILRSLQMVDSYRLVGVESDHLAAGLYNDGLEARYLVPRGDAPDYVDAILEIVERERAMVVWPCSDEEVIALSQHHETFARLGACVVTAAPEVIRRCTDKLAVIRFVESRGISVPRSCGLDEPVTDIPFPVIVRPKTGRGGKGVRFFDTPTELAGFRDVLGDQAKSYFVQEKLLVSVGHMHMVQAIFDRNDVIKALFASRSIRTIYPWGGPALGGVPTADDRVKSLGSEVMSMTGPWFGPVNVEFLFDPGRKDFVFVEVNPRFWGYSFLATAAGINFPDLTLRLALGRDFSAQMEYRLDVVTMTSREQLSFPRDVVLGDMPGEGLA